MVTVTPQPDPTYTGHTMAAVTIGGAVAMIVSWVVSLFGVMMPPEVSAAFSIVLTPLVSVAMKKMGMLSS